MSFQTMSNTKLTNDMVGKIATTHLELKGKVVTGKIQKVDLKNDTFDLKLSNGTVLSKVEAIQLNTVYG